MLCGANDCDTVSTRLNQPQQPETGPWLRTGTPDLLSPLHHDDFCFKSRDRKFLPAARLRRQLAAADWKLRSVAADARQHFHS